MTRCLFFSWEIFQSKDDSLIEIRWKLTSLHQKKKLAFSNTSNPWCVISCSSLLTFHLHCCITKNWAKTAGLTRNSNPSSYCFTRFQKWKSFGLVYGLSHPQIGSLRKLLCNTDSNTMFVKSGGGIPKLLQQNQRARPSAIPEPSGFLVCGMRLLGHWIFSCRNPAMDKFCPCR